MIISHKYKFIFVKTSKTASTSIEVYLSNLCADGDIFTPIIPAVEGHCPRNHEGYYNHITAGEIRSSISSKCWNGYYKFCLERNPWDKTLSWFYMLNKVSHPISWNEYIETRNFPYNYDKYMDIKSRVLLVDEIIYYENLNKGLANVFKRLGVPFGGELTVKAKANYRKNRISYREVIGQDDASLIGEVFKPEIDMHGYSF